MDDSIGVKRHWIWQGAFVLILAGVISKILSAVYQSPVSKHCRRCWILYISAGISFSWYCGHAVYIRISGHYFETDE